MFQQFFDSEHLTLSQYIFQDDVLRKRADIDTTNQHSTLIINDANRYDAGNYMVTVENNQGSRDFVFTVKVRYLHSYLLVL